MMYKDLVEVGQPDFCFLSFRSFELIDGDESFGEVGHASYVLNEYALELSMVIQCERRQVADELHFAVDSVDAGHDLVAGSTVDQVCLMGVAVPSAAAVNDGVDEMVTVEVAIVLGLF